LKDGIEKYKNVYKRTRKTIKNQKKRD